MRILARKPARKPGLPAVLIRLVKPVVQKLVKQAVQQVPAQMTVRMQHRAARVIHPPKPEPVRMMRPGMAVLRAVVHRMADLLIPVHRPVVQTKLRPVVLMA